MSKVSAGQLHRYIEIDSLEKKIKAEKKTLKEAILNELEKSNITHINDTEAGIVINLAMSERTTLDSKALKAEKPDVWETYAKTAEVKKLTVVKA